MTDNLFDRLADLLRSAGPVNWRLAREIAESSAGQAEPVDPWLAEEFRELAATAANHVAAVSSFDPVPLAARLEVFDRRGWAGGRVEDLAPLAVPLAARLGADTGPEMLQALGPAMVGLQVGGLVGAASHHVLGGFDLGLPGAGAPPALVASNVEGFAADHGLDPLQVRLWAVTREVSHHAALAVPWVGEQARRSLAAFVEGLEADPDALGERMAALQDPEALQRLVEEGGITAGLAPGPAALESLEGMRAVMALIDGYGEHLVDRALPGLVPQSEAIREAVDRSRSTASPDEVMLARMIGLDLKRPGYRTGTAFCAEVSRRWGDEALERVWQEPGALPDAVEVADPVGWAARVLL